MKSKTFPLYNIAACDIYSESASSELKIPNIQRGLVWKSQQMELLWDSILREFPIGSMLALKNDDSHYDILDGQQRSNAIITGFNTASIFDLSAPLSSILWLDVHFNTNESDVEFRRYGIRLTNSSHPWGFDESGGKLPAGKRREALRCAYGNTYPKLKKDWDIRKFVPFAFVGDDNYLPIPLAFFVSAAKGKDISYKEDINAFWDYISQELKEFSEISDYWKNQFYEKACEFIETNRNNFSLIEPFFKLNEYEVIFNYVDNNEEIEVLFNRVNKLGTRMTDSELAYAAIKHYGADLCTCQNIGKVIREQAKGLMLEQNLAQIIFRYCFSINRINREIDAKIIRKYSALCQSGQLPDKERRIISELRECFSSTGYLSSLINSSKAILLSSPDGCPLPSFLFAEIANSNPDLILLLFRLVHKQKAFIDTVSPTYIQALIIYLYCFSTDNRPIHYIFNSASSESFDKRNVQNVLRDAISREWCIPVVQSFRNFPALDNTNFSKSWAMNSFSNSRGYSSFNLLFPYKTSQGLFMLKYAQRQYYKDYFGDYDPSSKELWDEINRPWDHDHIIPQNWVSDVEWKNVQTAWINSMGNVADIPFEQNRGKSDDANWDYYKEVTNSQENDRLLYFDPRIEEIDAELLKKGFDSATIRLFELTRDRFIRISDEFLSLFHILEIENGLSPMQQERKNYFLYLLQNQFQDFSLYYLGNDNLEIKIDNLDDDYYWQRPWISLMENNDSMWRRSISVYCIVEDKLFQIERGRRKAPNLDLNSTNNLWWERGSWKGTRARSLINQGVISEHAQLFVSGAEIYNKLTGLSGFKANHSAFISYEGIIHGVEIYSHIYDYYSYCYCSIKCRKENESLPEIVLNTFSKERGFHWRHGNYCIECKMYGTDNIKKNCERFKAIIEELCSI